MTPITLDPITLAPILQACTRGQHDEALLKVLTALIERVEALSARVNAVERRVTRLDDPTA